MVIASNDRGARLVDVEAGREITTQSRARAKTSLTVLSGDGSRLVAANDEDTASLWDAARGELIANFGAHEGQVLAATFSGDGTLVLTGSHDATARLWDARTGKLLATLRGHDSSVLAVAISGDGTRLATASEDKTVRIWSREGREIAILKGHQGPVTSVVFLGGREELLTTSYDGTVRRFTFDPNHQIGLVLLIGIMAKNGILIVEFGNRLQEDGMERRKAVVEAAVLRLRPILMTTAAMVLGAVPLVLAEGAGAESRMQIGWVIVGGMTFGTLLTLFVVPCVYAIMGRRHGHQAPDEETPSAPQHDEPLKIAAQ